jgi:hypothetical protein
MSRGFGKRGCPQRDDEFDRAATTRGGGRRSDESRKEDEEKEAPLQSGESYLESFTIKPLARGAAWPRRHSLWAKQPAFRRPPIWHARRRRAWPVYRAKVRSTLAQYRCG